MQQAPSGCSTPPPSAIRRIADVKPGPPMSAMADEPPSNSHRLSTGPRPLPPFTSPEFTRCECRGTRKSNESCRSTTPFRAPPISRSRCPPAAVAIILTPLRLPRLRPTPLTRMQQRRCKETPHHRRQDNENRGRIDEQSETHENIKAA